MKATCLLTIQTEIVTPRLILRGPRLEDASELNSAIIESLGFLKPWMPWANTKPTLQESKDNIERSREKFLNQEDFQLFLVSKENLELVGCSGLHRFDLTVPRFEIGYWIRKKYLNQGYAKEAVMAISDFAFQELGAKRIELHIKSKNHLSVKVAISCGFELEATLKDFSRSLSDGSLEDRLIYSKFSCNLNSQMASMVEIEQV